MPKRVTSRRSAKIKKAQRAATIRIRGVEMRRIRYGDEVQDWSASEIDCHDCGVVKGQFHLRGCDVEQCPKCKGQLITCECRSAPRKVKAFSARDQKIVTARRNFKWRHVGYTSNGDARFEVTNNSSMHLPYLSVGVQGKNGTKLVGGAWLVVSAIPPRGRAIVQHSCYKETLTPNEVEYFEHPDPTPETKDQYWEFRRLEKS